MGEPLFSIILPTRDRPSLLDEALRSVVAQTVDDFECIVVDDGGRQPVRLPDDPRFSLVRLEGSTGVAAARNAGIARATGRYVVHLDDDDCYTPERLDLGLRGMDRAPVSICWTRDHIWTESKGWRPTGRVHSPVYEGEAGGTILARRIPHLGSCTMRRVDIPPFDERFTNGSDIEWWLRVGRGFPVTTEQEVGYVFRQHRGTRVTAQLEGRYRSRVLLLDVHRDYFASHKDAAAYHHSNLAKMARDLGRRRQAVDAFGRSMRYRPRLRTAALMVHALLAPDPRR